MPGPVLKPIEDLCAAIGSRIGTALEELRDDTPDIPPIGFSLFVFTFGEGGWMTFMSNAERESLTEALGEFIRRQNAPAVGPEAVEALIAEVDGVDNGTCVHCHRERYCDLKGNALLCGNDACWSNRMRRAVRP